MLQRNELEESCTKCERTCHARNDQVLLLNVALTKVRLFYYFIIIIIIILNLLFSFSRGTNAKKILLPFFIFLGYCFE